MILNNAAQIAAPNVNNAPKAIILLPGRIIIIMPIKPINMAIMLRQPTCSFNMGIENITTKIGTQKNMAVASIRLMNFNEKKNKAVSISSNMEREICINGRLP